MTRLHVDLLTPRDEGAYAAFVDSIPGTHVSHTLEYRAVLRDVLDARDAYLVAASGEEVVGALPLFLAEGPYGNVLNSLPFYGSHGGMVIPSDAPNPDEVLQALSSGLGDLARQLDAITATIVTGPLMPHRERFVARVSPWFVDERIGQICRLPSVEGAEATERAIAEAIDPKRWWDVRKARRLGVTCRGSVDIDDLRFLERIHAASMERLGVPPKTWSVFGSVIRHFPAGSGWRLFVADRDGERIGALLALYHGEIAEYFVPAVAEEHRGTQAGSLLVFEAMKHAAADGFRYWNLGGTAPVGQDGVYRFKRRWGATDEPYRYVGIGFAPTDALRELSAEQLRSSYPNFFVIPFRMLAGGSRSRSEVSA